MRPLPLGIVIPTRNSAALWKTGIEELKRVVAAAEQVVVVDSESVDGTTEFLRSALNNPHVRFLTNPPGLYASWNLGLSQLTSEFAYVATAGDTTNPAALGRLCSLAEELHADVVLSVPRFVNDDGKEQRAKRWPIHDVIEELRINAPRRLSNIQGFIAALPREALGGLMGSSASNLYRTQILQRNPFPVDFGRVGDSAWGISNALAIRFAVTPEKLADFVVHEKSSPISATDQIELEEKLLALAHDALHKAIAAEKVPPVARTLDVFLERFGRLRRELRICKEAYDTGRKRNPVWFFRPSILHARRERNRVRAELYRLWADALREYAV